MISSIHSWFRYWIIIGLGVCVAVSAFGQETNRQTNTPDTSSLIRIVDADTYQIGNLYINTTKREITIPGWVNMDDGLVEYLAVTPEGKTHESVLVLDVQPLHVQIALLLFGLDYGQNLEFQGDTTMPKGDSVDLKVGWVTETLDSIVVPATDLLFNLHDSTTIPPTLWVFSGSMIWDKQLVADMEGSIVATYSDPAAILNSPLPWRFDDTMYGANKQVLPPPGTPVIMIISIPEEK